MESASGGGADYRLVRLSLGPAGEENEVSLLGLYGPRERGLSLAARAGKGLLVAAGEAVMGTTPEAAEGSRAFMGRLTLVVRRSFVVEGGAAWCCGGRPSLLATRPAVLNGWRGGGWALRTVTHPATGTALKFLLAAAEQENPAGDELERRRTTEVLANWAWDDNWRGSLRWRCQKTGKWSRSQRFPWLPAVQDDPQVVTTTALTLRYEGVRNRVRVSVRTRDMVNGVDGGTRYLWAISGDRQTPGGWRLRSSWGTAWGDEIDLVSALNPLQGYVIPRHWSRWRQELMMGVGREIGPWRLQAGMASRDPAPTTASTGTVLEGWMEISARW